MSDFLAELIKKKKLSEKTMSTFFSKRVFSLSFGSLISSARKSDTKKFMFFNFFVSAFLVELIKEKKLTRNSHQVCPRNFE